MTFNGFISYSHAADGRLAPAVQRGLHRLAKPWHRRRALWIFRDQTGLAVTPALWSSIQDALDGSDYFVLLASPEAARSRWVNQEIEHWVATKSVDRILPVVTDGDWAWDRERQDFAEDSTAVPAALRGVFAEEPLFLDLRWARGDDHLSLQHSRFRDAIAQLAAPMHGMSKDDLEGEDVRQHRRVRRLLSGAVATLLVLVVLASVTGLLAVRNAERANASAAEARRQQQAAVEQRGNAERYATDAQQQQQLAQQQQARAADASAEAQRQQGLADQAAAEAALQQHEAGRQQKNAQRQQQLANQAATRTREQQQLAKESAAHAADAAAEAKRLALVAKERQRQAGEATDEARRQQAKADQQQRIAVSRRLLNQSKSAVVNDPKTALMLGVAAQQIQPDAETGSGLAGVVTSTHYTGTISDVTAVAFAPNGVLATVNTDGSVSLWDVADRSHPVRIASLGAAGLINGPVAFSPDGRSLAVLDAHNRAVLWSVADPSHPVRLVEVPTTESVFSLAFSPDGKMFGAGQYGGLATLWSITDRARPTLLSTLSTARFNQVEEVAFSADGRTVMETKFADNVLWDITDPADPVWIKSPDPRSAGKMAFHPKAPVVAIGDEDGNVSFSDLDVMNPAGEPADLAAPAPPRLPAEPAPSGSVEATPAPGPGAGSTPPGAVDPPLPPPFPADDPDPGLGYLTGLVGPVTALAYSADGRRIFAANSKGTAIVGDASDPAAARPIASMPIFGRVYSAAFSPDDKTLVTADSSATATLWNTTPPGTPEPIASVTDHSGHILAMRFRPDGRSLAEATTDGTAKLWNVTDPAHPVPGTGLSTYDGAVTSVAFSPDLRTVAAAGRKGPVKVTGMADPARPVPLSTIELGPRNLSAMAFGPDGRTLAVVTDNADLTLWDLAVPGRPALLCTLAGGNLGTPAFSPDGRTLAVAADDRSVRLWDVSVRSTPVLLATLSGHTAGVAALAFSPDGRTLATGSADSTAFLWDVTDRARPHRLATLTGSGSVVAVAFSPDGRTLASANADSSYALWDIADRVGPIRLAAAMIPPGQAGPMAFSPDGRTLAVAGGFNGEPESSTTLWNFTELSKIRANPGTYACAITGRGLSTGEWAGYIPELPYQHTCPG